MRKTLGRAELDLFGQVPVSFDEVLLWMLAVPKLPPTSPRFAAYVRDYNVPEKIRAAKIAGTFEEIVGSASAPAAQSPRRLTLAQAAAMTWRSVQE